VTVYAATYSAFRTAFTSKAPVSVPERKTGPRTPGDDATDSLGTLNGAPPNPWNPKIGSPEQRPDLLAGIAELAHLSKENSTEALTKGTGGTTFPFTRQKALEEAISKLGGELHAQYVLSFAPDLPTAGYHRLEVRIARRGDLRVRARPGYWTAEQPE
jgi:hypothetical protein